MKNIKSYSSTELRKKFSEAYNFVRYGGGAVTVTNHGDDSVVMMRKADVYPEPTAEELATLAEESGAFDDVKNDPVTYE